MRRMSAGRATLRQDLACGCNMATVSAEQGRNEGQNVPRDKLLRCIDGGGVSGHVLIVDDDQSMAETLTKAMTRRGFRVTWRTAASEALVVLDEQDFDVVVSDLHMEGMNGFAFCERVVANRPDVPVVIITAFGGRAAANSAPRSGPSDFIPKPMRSALIAESM